MSPFFFLIFFSFIFIQFLFPFSALSLFAERDFNSPCSFWFKSETDKSNEINYKVAILMRHFFAFVVRQKDSERLLACTNPFKKPRNLLCSWSFINNYWSEQNLKLFYVVLNCNKFTTIISPSSTLTNPIWMNITFNISGCFHFISFIPFFSSVTLFSKGYAVRSQCSTKIYLLSCLFSLWTLKLLQLSTNR